MPKIYSMTNWFEGDVKPTYNGVYEIRTEQWPFAHKAEWDGEFGYWSGWDTDSEQYVIITEPSSWRGIEKTEEEVEQYFIDELVKIKILFDEMEMDNG